MKYSIKTVIDIATEEIISRETFDYHGPVAHAFSVGGSKSNQQSNQQSTQQSGTRFNPDFMNQAINAYGAKPLSDQERAAATQNLTSLQNEYQQRYQNSINSRQPDPQLNILDSQIKAGQAGLQASDAAGNRPTYNPTYTSATYTPAAYTGATYTPVDQGDFAKIEANTYGSQASKLKQAYDTAQSQMREQLAQSGALNSPSQYLEGSARSSLDRTYIQNLQQAARDASTATLGLKQTEAARKTGFDVGQAAAQTGFGQTEAARQTGFSTGEAGRQTAFSQDVQQKLMEIFNAYIQAALQSGQYSTGQSTGQSQGGSSGGKFDIFSGQGSGSTGYGF